MTTFNTVLLRCRSCLTANRVPADRLPEHPKCGKCGAFLDFPKAPVEVTDSNFTHEVLDWPGIVVVFFWAPWCAHCRGMFPMLEDLARQKAGIIKVCLVNSEASPLLARQFSVMSVPRLMLYRNGTLINELNGAVQRQQLEDWLGYSLERR